MTEICLAREHLCRAFFLLEEDAIGASVVLASLLKRRPSMLLVMNRSDNQTHGAR